MSDPFAKALSEVGARVEAALDDILGPATKPGEIARPARLVEAMRWGALGGGKRLRPFLVIETARALGVTGEAPLKAGAAVECVHCYSLIHDDLPAMDDDELRRGRPTVHRQFDEATAILAGDALLTLAFEILGDSALGAAFQIADDILDAESTAEKLGKRAGKDADRNKATYVAALGLPEAKALCEAKVAEALAAIDAAGLGPEGDLLRAAARFVAERSN